MSPKFLPILFAASLLAILAGKPSAQQAKLPATLTLTAYETGSNGFNQAVAVGQMFKERFGTDVRVLPAGNDVARLAPLKAGRAQASAMGIGTYFAQEGVLEFATREWGPQPLQLMLAASTCSGQSLGVANDVGVKTFADMKGKRVGFVVGSPAVNQSVLALIAFGGWTPMPASDKAGWARVQTIAPYFYPHTSSCGAGYAKGQVIDTSVYPYPIFMAYGTQDANTIYSMTSAMLSHYDAYKDSVQGVDGLEGKRQNYQWTMPCHAGAVRALAKAKLWTDAAAKHNDGPLRRQAMLANAWTEFLKTNPPEDRDQFREAWMQTRAAALNSAGMPVLFCSLV